MTAWKDRHSLKLFCSMSERKGGGNPVNQTGTAQSLRNIKTNNIMKTLAKILILFAFIFLTGSCATSRHQSNYLPFARHTKNHTIKRMSPQQLRRAKQGYTMYHNKNGQVKKIRSFSR